MTTMVKPAQPPIEGGEQRVSVVTGDRLCVACGYNLIGQMVLREPHYGLLIIRCPECATIASVQEYPLLGRWAARWGAIVAALWFIFLLSAWPLTSAAIFGMALAMAEESTHPYGQYLSSLQGDTPQSVALPGGRTITYRIPSDDFEDWWKQQDKSALLDQAGGVIGAIDWVAALILIPAWLIAATVGWFWSVALLQFRRRWLLIWGVALMGLALLYALGPILEWQLVGPRWGWGAARQQLGIPILLVTLALSIPALAAGLWWGRPLTRLLVRALLPPGLRGSLALLWTAEGHDPPRVAPAAQRR